MGSEIDQDVKIDSNFSFLKVTRFGNKSQIYTMVIVSFIVILIVAIPYVMLMTNDCPDGDGGALFNHPTVSRTLSGMFHDNTQHFDPRDVKPGKIVSSCLVHSTNDKNYATATNCSTQPLSLVNVLQQRRTTGTCTYCCETVWDSIVPLTVSYESVIYNVYHPESGWQIVIQGVCKDGSNCVAGNCATADTWYTWILIEDPDLTEEPKVRFVPISYPQYCYCLY